MTQPNHIRYLAGPCEGMKIERRGKTTRLLCRDGYEVRAVTCQFEEDAMLAVFWMAEDAYREATP